MIKIALQRPTLNNIAAFDAAEGGEYTFIVTGGEQWLGVLMTIKDNTTPSNPDIEIFTTTQTNIGLITANVLTNGHQYQATIQTTTSSTKAGMTSGNTSQPSNSVSFYCYTQPSFVFTNITQDGVIASSTYAFNVEYRQTEGEYLSSYQVILYDEYNTELYNSGVLNAPEQIVSGDTVICNLVHTIDGFLDGQHRKIIMYGTTTEGTKLETLLISFSIAYIEVEKYTEIYAINNCDNGNITVGSTLDVVSGRPYREPVIFYPNIEMGTEADLRNNGVVWTDVIDAENFSVFFQFRAPILDQPHLLLTHNNQYISQTTFNISEVLEGRVYNSIVANTNVYDDNGYIIDTIETQYDVSTQELDNINYTIDSTIYGFMIRRSSDTFTSQLVMLHEPIEALSNHYIDNRESTEFDVEDVGGGNIVISSGLTAVDDGEGNLTISIDNGYTIPIADISNGNIIIGKYEDNGWLTGIYLSDTHGDIPIRFALGDQNAPKDIDDLEEGDTYLWAFTEDDTIDLTADNFAIIGDLLYYYPHGKGDM